MKVACSKINLDFKILNLEVTPSPFYANVAQPGTAQDWKLLARYLVSFGISRFKLEQSESLLITKRKRSDVANQNLFGESPGVGAFLLKQ